MVIILKYPRLKRRTNVSNLSYWCFLKDYLQYTLVRCHLKNFSNNLECNFHLHWKSTSLFAQSNSISPRALRATSILIRKKISFWNKIQPSVAFCFQFQVDKRHTHASYLKSKADATSKQTGKTTRRLRRCHIRDLYSRMTSQKYPKLAPSQKEVTNVADELYISIHMRG